VGDPHVKAGKVRVLASWGATRLPSIANVPTMKELGVDAEFYIWSGLFVPTGTPQPVVDKLRDAARRAARQDPDFERAMSGMNTPIAYKEGAEFQAFIDADGARLAKVIRAMGKVE
jgi:tripartite-type tricarboxylate transporter receptor subunit TctC